MPYKPGQSGNPKGRPPNGLALKKLAETHTKEALNLLLTAMRTADRWADRITAADKILDRAHGKVTQKMQLEGEDGGPLQVIINIQQKNAQN